MPLLNRLTGGLFAARTAQAVATRDAFQNGARGIDGGYTADDPRAAGGALCGAAGCTSAWGKPWKSRRRPVFEEDWACSTACLETLVRAATRREVGDSGGGLAELEAHRHRVPLGLVLLAQGWITHSQLQAALDAQRVAGEGRVGEWLTRHCGLEEDRIARGLSLQWSCPVLSLEGFSPRAMALMMPRRFIREFGMVPLRVAGSSVLYVAFQEQLNASVALTLEQMSGLKVESGLLTTSQLNSAKARILSEEAVPVRMSAVKDADDLASSVVKLLRQGQPVASRMVRVQQYYWLRMWMEGVLPASVEDTQDHLFTMG